MILALHANMKPIKHISVAVFALLAIAAMSASCQKYRDRVASGSMVDATSRQPLANQKFYLYVSVVGSPLSKERKSRDIDYPFTTDDKGNFQVAFEAKDQKITIGDAHIRPTDGDTGYWHKYLSKKELSVNTGVIEVDKK